MRDRKNHGVQVEKENKFKTSQSAGKLMGTVFWDSDGILLVDYKDKGFSIPGEYYASILKRLKEAIKEKRRKIDERCVAFARQRARPQEPCCVGRPAG